MPFELGYRLSETKTSFDSDEIVIGLDKWKKVKFQFRESINTVVFYFKAAFLMTRSLKTGLKLENFRTSSDDIAKKPYFLNFEKSTI